MLLLGLLALLICRDGITSTEIIGRFDQRGTITAEWSRVNIKRCGGLPSNLEKRSSFSRST